MDSREYHDFVQDAEGGLASYAKKSFSSDSPNFLNGTPILKYFQDQWRTAGGQLKLANRTPLQLQRDRILYSSGLRKQTEKYHVLYHGPRRIIRNYTTHTMRMAHVTRSICKALDLNSDFAEAIAIGSKVGAGPFVHVSKDVASDWLQKRLQEISEAQLRKNPDYPNEAAPQLHLFPSVTNVPTPKWLNGIESPKVIEEVKKFLPCAVGDNVDSAYSSGAESYWLLCTQPFLRESIRSNYHPETMYGIWRHNRKIRPRNGSFYHECNLQDSTKHQITWEHSTFEGLVVQFSDDMTWIIENLNDANDAALLGGTNDNLFLQLKNSLGEIPSELSGALVDSDAGALYTYFIMDFVRNSQNVLTPSVDGASICSALREGESEALIGPSADAEDYLNRMHRFLFDNVFEAPRIRNRNRMLQSVSQVSLDLLYDTNESALQQMMKDRATLENWAGDKRKKAQELFTNDVHRAQLAVDVFVNMGDQELFEFVGIQSF